MVTSTLPPTPTPGSSSSRMWVMFATAPRMRPTRHRSGVASRRSIAVVIVAGSVVGLAACGGTSSSNSDASGSTATTPDLSDYAHRFEEVARFGSGRAVATAATDSVTVIASTINIDVHRDGRVEEIPTALPLPITDVRISPDSNSVALLAATGDGELWSLDPMGLVSSLEDAEAARFTDDSQWVDVTGRESAARLSATDGSLAARSARPTPGPINTVTWFGPDGQTLIVRGDSTSRPGEVWDGTELVDASYEPGGLFRVVRAVGDPLADRAVFGITGGAGAVGSLASVDLATGEEQWRQEAGNDAVQRVWSVGHDGNVLAVVGNQVRLYGLDGAIENSWDLDTIDAVDTVIAFGDRPGYAIAGADGAVVFVDATGNQVAAAPATGKRLINPQAVTGVGGVIAADAVGHVRQWDATGKLIAENVDYLGGAINDVAVSADGLSAATAASDGNVGLIDLASTSAVEPLPGGFSHPEGNVDTVVFMADDSGVISGVSEANGTSSFDDTLSRWDLASGDRSFVIPGVPEYISGCTNFRNTVRLSADGDTFAATHHDFAVSLRSADDGSLIHEFTGHTSIVWDLAFSPDGRWLATSSEDWTLRLWDLDGFRLHSTIEAPPGGYASVAFTPDSDSMIVSDSTGNLSMLDVGTEALTASFDGQKSATARMAVSPDGRYVVAGADGGVVRIWEIATGRIVQDLEGHAAKVTGVGFTPDGRGLVSGSVDGTTRLWRV